MPNSKNSLIKLILYPISLIIFLCSCASVQQPTGGPKDRTPPKVISENPKNLTRNFSAKQIRIEFDEFIKLSNESKEISISPSMEQLPVFKVRKDVLDIKFLDTLEKNTTYTINFGKAIVDYNEGNILKNYLYAFSTGNTIDSLSISGNVKNSISKEPILDATVFIFPTSQDTSFGKRKSNISTTTDSAGNYTLHNLKEGSYKIYALKEQGGDRIYNSTKEEIGFYDSTLQLNRNIQNINLETFNELPETFNTLDRKIESTGRITLTFNRPLTEPSFTILQPAELNSTKEEEFNKGLDTGFIWLPKLEFDSITVAVKDKSVNMDTVVLRRGTKDNYNRQIIITDNISGRINRRSGVELEFSAPVSTINNAKVILTEDSVTIKNWRLQKDTSTLRKYKLVYPWREKRDYELKFEDNAVTGKYGGTNKVYTTRFTLESDENFGNLETNISVPDSGKTYILQLIKDKTIIKTAVIRKSEIVSFRFMPAGTYSMRVIYDENNNELWDTGNVKKRQQPEQIWNYETPLLIRANWDQEERITIPKPQ